MNNFSLIKWAFLLTLLDRLSVCSNREIGRNLDRSRCWKERQGYKKKKLKLHNATSDPNSGKLKGRHQNIASFSQWINFLAGGSEFGEVDERRQTAQEIVNRIFYGAMALLAVTITLSLAFNVYHWVSTHYGYLYKSRWGRFLSITQTICRTHRLKKNGEKEITYFAIISAQIC